MQFMNWPGMFPNISNSSAIPTSTVASLFSNNVSYSLLDTSLQSYMYYFVYYYSFLLLFINNNIKGLGFWHPIMRREVMLNFFKIPSLSLPLNYMPFLFGETLLLFPLTSVL